MLVLGVATGASGADGKRVVFWNLENFFDYFDSGTSDSDAEFSSYGSRHWNKAKFRAKCDAVAKTLLWIADQYGGLPDVVGFAEVENSFPVRCILTRTVLKKSDYTFVHYDSPDSRGIDVALIYRQEIYELLSSKPCHIYDSQGNIMKTRDILLVSLKDRRSGETVHFLVNHHPSKYGGETVSQPRRAAAMGRLKGICDSLLVLPQEGSLGGGKGLPDSPGGRIVAMGDFNDTPDNPLFGIFGGSMENLALEPFKRHEWTIRYAGKGDLIDMFIVSPAVAAEYEMKIVQVPFLMTRDNTHVGEKPLRTYSGPRYIGGVSDHCPIILLPRSK